MANAILDGEVSNIEQFPYMVSVRIRDNHNVFHNHCGGAIIGHKNVITSAYCKDREYRNLPSDYVVSVGSNRKDEKTRKDIQLKRFVVNEKFNK